MAYEIINNIITGDGRLRDHDGETLYGSPGNEITLCVHTKYKLNGDISITTGINKAPVPFTVIEPTCFFRNWGEDKFVRYVITFIMPFGNVTVDGLFTTKWEENEMPDFRDIAEKKKVPGPDGVIDTFTIPEELAQELSDLLIKQSIRQNTVNACVGDPEKYEQAEALLVPIAARIDKIKYQISTELVPMKYRSSRYRWNFNGWEIDNNVLEILYA